MKGNTGGAKKRVTETEFSAAVSFDRYMDHVPAAFGVTRGDQHTLVYANAAFRTLIASDGEPLVGTPITNAFAIRKTTGLTALLDRAFRTGVVARNRRIEPVDESAPGLSCTVWPEVNKNGESEHLVIELRVATDAELTLGLQREVAERLLLSALREQDAADVAKVSVRGARFLASESRRLAESLDEDATLIAMARMSLPNFGAWCIVDTLDDDDTMHRLAIIHPDPAKQTLIDELEGRWIPAIGDGFGVPAALLSAKPTVIADDLDSVLATAAHDPQIYRVLRELGVGTLLTMPLIVRKRLIGAVTFVGTQHGRPFSPEDMELAEDLASRSAMALDRARLYGEALALRARAESANLTKNAFLGMMSHELRTPLNAIGGYVDLMDMEIHGPVTEAQHADLARIRTNQRYLMGLISDLLNLTKVSSGQLVYDIRDIIARAVLASSVGLVEPLFAQKHLIYDGIACDASIVVSGDLEKVIQILVNLLSNAIKFTPPGGRLVVDCEAKGDAVLMRVSDTGIGIQPEKLDVIFDPFVQVKGGTTGPESGIGLGLAISRSLARGMHGDLTVESTLGKGARFTLTLPRSSTTPPPDHHAA
jgi:signal transduction histidine kinase